MKAIWNWVGSPARMIWFTFPGQNVPEWLERVEVLEGGYFGSLKFSNFNLIWKHKGKFHVIGLLHRPCLTLSDSDNIALYGQGAGVWFHGTLAGLVISMIKRISDRLKADAKRIKAKLKEKNR